MLSQNTGVNLMGIAYSYIRFSALIAGAKLLEFHFCSVPVMHTKLDVHFEECSLYKNRSESQTDPSVPRFNLESIINLDKFE